MASADPSAAGSAPSFWDAIPLDEAVVPAPNPTRTPRQTDEAYASLVNGTHEFPVVPHLAVERTDIG
jgi:hypothetical protein